MHAVWVRLCNVYAKLITEEIEKGPQTFQPTSKKTEESDEMIFQEIFKMVIASLQIAIISGL